MTVKLGMFTMPFHHPARDYATILEEDQAAVVLADRLGFTEAYVGEHFSSWSERITSPLIFLASVIGRTRRIRFGTGVINLPQLHPATSGRCRCHDWDQPKLWRRSMELLATAVMPRFARHAGATRA